jgi:hypothetical protein
MRPPQATARDAEPSVRPRKKQEIHEGVPVHRPAVARLSATAATAIALALLANVPAVADEAFATESARLAGQVRAGLLDAGFDRLVDFDNVVDGVAQPQAALPNIDVAVIELDASGAVIGAANVLYDRDNPAGYVVPIDRVDLAPQGVQFSEWNLDRFEDPSLWAAGPQPGDVVLSSGSKPFMAPYPASVLKVMVGYSILRAVDDGVLALDQKLSFTAVKGEKCGNPASNPRGFKPKPKKGATATVREWMDQMITVSDNYATCALLQALYDVGRLDESNMHFAELGLTTLRMLPRVPAVGSGWLSGTMTMGALDTARLMLIVAGAPGTLWTAGNRTVTAAELTDVSRTFFLDLLRQQSYNEVLNPVNLCGAPTTDAVQGIPSTVASRWIQADSGSVLTYDGDLVIDFFYDVRPCVAQAEVEFAHKTGLISVAGADAGIVTALPGEDGRRYVVAVQSSVGYRYGAPDWATSTPDACEGSPYVCYPPAFGRLGKAIDDAVKSRP